MIRFLNLQKINFQYSEELKQVASEIIDSGRYILGERVKRFEDNLSCYLGVKFTVGIGNGLDALRLILRAYIEMGIFNVNDEIIVPANTFIATILSITENGLTPVLVEPDINTYNLDISLVKSKITSRTKAIIVVHLYGRVCWDDKLLEFAQENGLKIIEDNAQAMGATWKGKKTGSLGDTSANSFYPSKNLGALGDAGAVTTDDKDLAMMVRALGNYGSLSKYIHDVKGINSRMDELQAGFLDVKLKYLDEENERRKRIAMYYHYNIDNEKIIKPTKGIISSVWHLFVIRTDKRNELQSYLRKNEVETLIHYPIPPHKQLAYKEWNDYNFPITEKISREVLSLPISPVMSQSEIETIVELINKW